MKKLIVFLSILFSSTLVHAQLRKIPSEVTDSFKVKYPDASNVEWRDNLTNFEATFKQDTDECSAQFNSKGEWKQTEKKMSFDELPSAVKDGFNKSKYSDWKPGTSKFIQQKDKDAVYKVYAEKNSLVQKVFLYFNEKGQLVREAPGYKTISYKLNYGFEGALFI